MERDEQLGLRNILHNVAQWLLTDRQIIKGISKSTKGGGSQTWHSELYRMLEMRCFVAAIEHGET
eukprot:8645453-Ditylum_brightwellii.AAC.1